MKVTVTIGTSREYDVTLPGNEHTVQEVLTALRNQHPTSQSHMPTVVDLQGWTGKSWTKVQPGTRITGNKGELQILPGGGVKKNK